ncbi:MAG: tRNA pseudouridine(55) synthase TruB [Spirochaetia bacterium]|nr:tRNA pseudouridine(55) synthase TruB [Spirochaetia bacterium]
MTAIGEPSLSGFAILDKPEGITSFRFLSQLSRKLGSTVKSGHAGTLDSFATGVLVCLFGRYTRLSDYFMSAVKGYEADILFGEETDTLDPGGTVVAMAAIPTLEALESSLENFRGEILQSPPAYSAVHIDGERASERARKGQDVEPVARPVRIDSLELLSYEEGTARIRVACSKGTYIRSLARDIALACASRGRLSRLRRTFSGPFTLSEAMPQEDFGPASLKTMSLADAKGLGLEPLTLDTEDVKGFSNGLPLSRLNVSRSLSGKGPRAVFSNEGTLLGILTLSGKEWKYAFVLGGTL